MTTRTKQHTAFRIIAAAALLMWQIAPAIAEDTAQKTFSTPEEAAKALAEAGKNKDTAALIGMFGEQAKDLASSGDPVMDRNAAEKFATAVRQKVRVNKSDTTAVVVLGTANWPFPVPLVKRNDKWLFDTEAGREEIQNRRIGRNELSTIKVCKTYVEAQKEYASADRDNDEVLEYAQRILSTPGTKDGLFWESAAGEAPSPFGPAVAEARAEGYSADAEGGPKPYHGYVFRIVKRQGAAAPGGKYDYVINGNMIGGFALVAYPADYGNSGVMTFMVNQQGKVYEKDLGKGTEKAAKGLIEYSPDKTWKPVKP